MNMCHHICHHTTRTLFFHSHSLISLRLRVCHLFCNCQMSILFDSPLVPSFPPLTSLSSSTDARTIAGLCLWHVCRREVCLPPHTPKPLYYTKTTLTEPPSRSAGPLSPCGRGSPLLSDRLTQVPPFSPVPPPHAGPKVLKRPEAENEEAIYTASHSTGSKKREEKDNER